MSDCVYKKLAERLDAIPNGFPPTESGVELRLLAWLFTPEEAELATKLHLTLETPSQITERIGGDAKSLRFQLKAMAKRGLIKAGRPESGKGLGFGLLPFAVGIYEFQSNKIDTEMAQMFEAYYWEAYGKLLSIKPYVHRVIPVEQTVKNNMEIHPYESAATIIDGAKAWGVTDCICRKQKALIGDPCDHPLDVCMVMSTRRGTFDSALGVRALTRDEALATLRRAAEAGLVHSVSNNQEGLWYICNCCTCSCSVLRAMSDLGMANVVARSAFLCQVDDERCAGCGLCVDQCQFHALELTDLAVVNAIMCVGCGVCALSCPEDALSLIRRPEEEIQLPPPTEADWWSERAQVRGVDLLKVL